VNPLQLIDEGEVQAFVSRLPIAVNRQNFSNFVLGFPKRYVRQTLPTEIVKHYVLAESLGAKTVISSISRGTEIWKLCLIARDRSFLFCRIAGTLSCFGMNIVSAEAFANASALVLDTFTFTDPEDYFATDRHRRHFQVLLEDVVEGKTDIEPLVRKRADRLGFHESVGVTWDNDVHPLASCLTIDARDHFGLLYLLSRCIADAGYNVEAAYITTQNERARDEFYLSRDGKKLSPAMQEGLERKLTSLKGMAPSGGGTV